MQRIKIVTYAWAWADGAARRAVPLAGMHDTVPGSMACQSLANAQTRRPGNPLKAVLAELSHLRHFLA